MVDKNLSMCLISSTESWVFGENLLFEWFCLKDDDTCWSCAVILSSPACVDNPLKNVGQVSSSSWNPQGFSGNVSQIISLKISSSFSKKLLILSLPRLFENMNSVRKGRAFCSDYHYCFPAWCFKTSFTVSFYWNSNIFYKYRYYFQYLRVT